MFAFISWGRLWLVRLRGSIRRRDVPSDRVGFAPFLIVTVARCRVGLWLEGVAVDEHLCDDRGCSQAFLDAFQGGLLSLG
jgi:hypothetical protein